MENLGAPNDSGAGNILGRYELLYALSAGGFGQVYAACARSAGGFRTLMAVKILHPALLIDGANVKAFADEARLGGRLQHPNIARVFEFSEQDGQYYLVLELIDGLNFSELVSRYQEVGMANALELIAQACDGVQCAHEAVDDEGQSLSLVHRDLKPPNLMLDRAGLVKVMDFGIARADMDGRDRTVTGTLKGTPAYMAPEAARGERHIDYRVDIFALGLVLFELLFGERLYGKGSPMALLHVAATGQYLTKLKEFLQTVDDDVAAIVERALKSDPSERYQSVHDMAVACRKVARKMDVGPDIRALARTLAPRAIHLLPSETSQRFLGEKARQKLASGMPLTEVGVTSADAGIGRQAIPETQVQGSPETLQTMMDAGDTIAAQTQQLGRQGTRGAKQFTPQPRTEYLDTAQRVEEAKTMVDGAGRQSARQASGASPMATSLLPGRGENLAPETALLPAATTLLPPATTVLPPATVMMSGQNAVPEAPAKPAASSSPKTLLVLGLIAGALGAFGVAQFSKNPPTNEPLAGLEEPAGADLASQGDAPVAVVVETPKPTPEPSPTAEATPKPTPVPKRVVASKPVSRRSEAPKNQGHKASTAKAVKKNLQMVTVIFNTAPEEQSIWIDGKSQSGRTPWSGQLLEGEHTLAVGSATGFVHTIHLKAGEPQTWLALKSGNDWEFIRGK